MGDCMYYRVAALGRLKSKVTEHVVIETSEEQ